MSVRLTLGQFKEQAKRKHGDRYDYSSVEYINATTSVIIICPDHGVFKQTPNNHVSGGKGCPTCGRLSTINSRRVKVSDLLDRFVSVHGDRYDYSQMIFERMDSPITIICPDHGAFEQTPIKHCSGQRCPVCAAIDVANNQRMSHDEFVALANQVHIDRYTYPNTYMGSKTPLSIECPTHGAFTQLPATHLSGRGCPQCAGNVNKTTAEFIATATEVHGSRYDYSLVDYINAKTKVKIICPDHGVFEQLPNTHLRGSGCNVCGNTKTGFALMLSHDEFVKSATSVHNGVYQYESPYVGTLNKLDIICPIHGVFSQLSGNHLQGSGCPKCNHTISKGETEIREFISQYTETKGSDRDLIPPKEIDIVMPSYSMGVEYCGLYWHSSAVGKTPRYHVEKHEAVEQTGYRLITIFEDEWIHKRHIVEDTLRHFVGKSPKGVGARNTQIREIDWKTAKKFLDHRHLMGSGKPGNYRIGAFHGDELISVMVFGSPSDERGADEIVEMKRFATNGKNNPGVGSKMFAYARKQRGYTKVIAFVDRRWFTGSFKFVSGFRVDGYTPPAKFFTKGKVRKHRRFISKKQLVQSGQFDTTMTKDEMLQQLQWYSIYDCGKVRLVWEAPE